jgi:hypothetical protein
MTVSGNIFRHIDDDGPLNILVNTSGKVLITCSICDRYWRTSVSPLVEVPPAEQVSIVDSLQGSPSAEILGIDVDRLT